MIVEKEVLRPHDCREDIEECEKARAREDKPVLWAGSVLRCAICDARWEKRDSQRDGVYWAKIVDGVQPAVLKPGGPVQPLRYPQLPASDRRNDPRWFNCPSDICSAFRTHAQECPEYAKQNSDGKPV